MNNPVQGVISKLVLVRVAPSLFSPLVIKNQLTLPSHTIFLLSLYRCAIDETVQFIPTVEERIQRYTLEAFSFVGDHPFVYLHCKVKICNATDPNSRCAQGCLHDRRKRSLYSEETNDEEYNLDQGPFMLQEEDIHEGNLQETVDGIHSLEITGKL